MRLRPGASAGDAQSSAWRTVLNSSALTWSCPKRQQGTDRTGQSPPARKIPLQPFHRKAEPIALHPGTQRTRAEKSAETQAAYVAVSKCLAKSPPVECPRY